AGPPSDDSPADGISGATPHVSLYDVVQAQTKGDTAQLQRWFAGRIVLLGSATVDDRYPTPFYTAINGEHRTTAGIEIMAGTVRTLLARAYLLDVPGWFRAAGLLASAGVASLIVTGLEAG